MPTTHCKAPERKARAISDIRRAVLYSPNWRIHSNACLSNAGCVHRHDTTLLD
jgi:hypothetical protein